MYPPHHLGGYELVWASAMSHLRGLGHEVLVLTTDFRKPQAAGEREEAGVHRELRWYWRDHEFPRLGLRECFALERHNARTLDRHVAQLRPDVVTWWAMGGMSLSLIEQARRAALPAVGFVHDDWLIYGPRVDQWTARFRARPALARAAELLARLPARLDLGAAAQWLFVSDDTRRRAVEHSGFDLPRTGVAHSGIDARWLDPRPEHEWRWQLLSVGRIDERKGIDTAIEALAALPAQARLMVVGDGDERALAALRALAGRRGVPERVEFAGARPRSELPELYGRSDVVLFPVRWDEPWGLVPIEAMALGRPVVATGRGGSAEYLRDGENCLLFPAGDAAALAAAVSRLAQDGPLRARLRAGGEETAPRHTDAVFNATVADAIERAYFDSRSAASHAAR
jgi:glycosyltransferase involved in cell wall biosynthesis